MKSWNKMTLTGQILIAMGAGTALGVLLNIFAHDVSFVKNVIDGGIFVVVGKVFVRGLFMMVVPLVFVSLAMGVAKLGDIVTLGRIGAKTIGLYLITTAIAISIAILLATLIGPGEGAELTSSAEFSANDAPPFTQVLIDIIPGNPVAAMAEANMLQIIFFALLFGIGITLSGERGQHVLNFFTDLDGIIMQMVIIVMKVAPYGVFCLIAHTFYTEGIGIFLQLMKYFLVVVFAYIVHVTIVYNALLIIVGKLSPLRFFEKMRSVWVFAFSVASSNATIPMTLNTVINRLGVKNSVASFTIPLGATINMDGTSIMMGVATVFIANAYGIELTLIQFLMVIGTATLASIGTAGVPGVGLIMLAMVLKQVNLPVEGIGLIIGVDRLLDMMRTVVNISGDAAVTCIVAKSEKALDQSVYDDPDAGVIVPGESELPPV